MDDRIIVSSQGVVVVNVGGENGTLKQSFIVHRELLMLNSNFFRSLLGEKVKVEVKKDEEMGIKSEEIEMSGRGQEIARTIEMREEPALALAEQREERMIGGGRMHTSSGDGEGHELAEPRTGAIYLLRRC
jgi:hypothetical protein